MARRITSKRPDQAREGGARKCRKDIDVARKRGGGYATQPRVGGP